MSNQYKARQAQAQAHKMFNIKNTIGKEMDMKRRNEMRNIFKVAAPYAPKVYLTTYNGMIRLTFTEPIPELADECVPICAITLTPVDFQNMVNMFMSVMAQAEQQIKQAQENAPLAGELPPEGSGETPPN